jgi:hypothetical protein
LLCGANIVSLSGGRKRQRRRQKDKTRMTTPSGQPTAERPDLPAAYDIQDAQSGQGLLAWSVVSQRLSTVANYWICTTRPDGRPHAVPVWGVWLDEAFYFGTHRDSAKARNLANNPYLSLHLDSSDEVVILEGSVDEVVDPAVRALVDQTMASKYDLEPGNTGGEVNPLYTVRPEIAFAWSFDEFGKSATRWTFGS